MTTACCWACGRQGAEPLHEYLPTRLYRCAGCGLGFQAERRDEELAALYDDEYFAHEDLREEETRADRTFEARVRVRLVQRHLRAGRLLEVGAAAGYFLATARGSGFEAFGIELSPAIAAAGRRRFGVDIAAGSIADIDLEPGSFGVACGWHVLEHLVDPVVALERIAAALRPGGFAFFEVPNFGGIRARREGAAWPLLQPEHHVAQYTPAALAAVLERAGFALVTLESVPFSVYRRPLRAVLSRVKQGLVMRTVPLGSDPSKYDLLRAVARTA